MKRSEIALITLVSIIVIVTTYILGGLFFGDLSEEVTSIKYLVPIDSKVVAPSEDFFNAYAHNPTVEIYVGSCGVDEVWDTNSLKCVKQGGDNSQPSDNTGDDTDDEPNGDDETPEN